MQIPKIKIPSHTRLTLENDTDKVVRLSDISKFIEETMGLLVDEEYNAVHTSVLLAKALEEAKNE